ncbi:VOC family protein [Miltoncostaea oceani]|jgi:catechol 2,3-dioxygenase-like lactoylglutathione lyase family enzyme|uniref:VOC family protein n=1 Tax=Miltoncostaea oceani TaxID=2843216 RepID=UPI001C3C4128|nr:VOC family protein [Miltoncostaea oceani]
MSTTRLAHVGLWVHDQEEALAFYTGTLGFEVREDVTLPELGGYRWLTVALPGELTGFILNVPEPPMFDEETCRSVLEMVARGRTGGFMLECDDCRATFEDLRARGAEFTQEPTEQPYGIDAGLRDPSGNHIRLVQRTDAPGY